MINLKKIKENPKKITNLLKKRNDNSYKKISQILSVYHEKNKNLQKIENLKKEKNLLVKFISTNSKKHDSEKLKSSIEKTKLINNQIKKYQDIFLIKEKELQKLMLRMPNYPLEEVPFGKGEEDNQVIQTFIIGKGMIKCFVPHYEIGKKLDILDIERAVKISGSRFIIYKKDGAKLIRSLINYMLDFHIKNGYIELNTPHILKEEMFVGTGQLPKFKKDLFKIDSEEKQWLIPTAEVSLTNYHHNEILDLENSKKFTGYTKCFRSEAGSGGRDTRGIIRSREFHKVELVNISSEEKAHSDFWEMIENVKELLEKFQIPFRTVELCTGDLGFSSQKTIDFEIWIPSEQKFREISSVSFFGDFQGRRTKIRYKKDNKNYYAYTINGSGLAIDRLVAAILENYQISDQKIEVPKVLKKYFNKDFLEK